MVEFHSVVSEEKSKMWNVNDDGWRTDDRQTDDGERMITIVHLSLRLRCTNNYIDICLIHSKYHMCMYDRMKNIYAQNQSSILEARSIVLAYRKPFITELFEEHSYLFSTWSTSQFCCCFVMRIYFASAIFQSYFKEITNLWYRSGETGNTGPLAPQANCKSLTNKPPLMSFDFHNHA